ncbi:MAG: DUF4176 domain-containing protein [Christensenellaceae bacterium]
MLEKKRVEMQENGEYLPIGSVVEIEGIEKLVLIIGKLQYNGSNKEEIFDYAGVDYPEVFLKLR